MGLNNRYFITENPFMGTFWQGNSYFFTNEVSDEDKNLEIPFLVACSYYFRTPSFIIYYQKNIDKIVAGVSGTTGFYQSLPCKTNCLNYGNFVFYQTNQSANSSLNYVLKRKGRTKNDEELKDYWVTSRTNFLNINDLYPLKSDRLDIDYSLSGGTTRGFHVLDSSLIFPEIDKTYSMRYYNGGEESSYSHSSKIFSSSSNIYYPSESGLDCTPEDKKVYEDLKAGLWINSSSNKIYFGLPFFEITFKVKEMDEDENEKEVEKKIKTFAVHPFYKTVLKLTKSAVDETKNDIITTSTFDILDSDEGYVLKYYNVQINTWNGTGYTNTYERFYGFGYEQREKNGGFYKKTAMNFSVSSSYLAEEENESKFDDLSFNEDGQTFIKIKYIGSSLEQNLFAKYHKNETFESTRSYCFKNTFFFKEDEGK